MKVWLRALWLVGLGCSGSAGSGPEGPVPPPPTDVAETADVTAASASGEPGRYTFSVTIASPDTGCERYADWWEVVDADGRLLYRRILLHSHVDEQPFTRSGGPVPVAASDPVWVRAHLSTGGYGRAMTGTVEAGFGAAVPPDGFGAGLEAEAPQPDGCAF